MHSNDVGIVRDLRNSYAFALRIKKLIVSIERVLAVPINYISQSFVLSFFQEIMKTPRDETIGVIKRGRRLFSSIVVFRVHRPRLLIGRHTC